MAGQTLVLDASVGVKWFSAEGEDAVTQARMLLQAQAHGNIDLVVPDLFFHEISNALVHRKMLSLPRIEESISMLFDLKLSIFLSDQEFFRNASRLARGNNITEYDACYVVAAISIKCPLVTANPRHQQQELGCQVIPIKDWK